MWGCTDNEAERKSADSLRGLLTVFIISAPSPMRVVMSLAPCPLSSFPQVAHNRTVREHSDFFF